MSGKWSPEKRLAVIEAILHSGNKRDACKQHGMDATTFYKLEKRIAGLSRDQQLEALKDRSRRWKSHRQQTTKDQRAAIRSLSLAHPSWGCNQIQQALARDGIKRSPTTIQKVMAEEGLGTGRDRWLALDRPEAQLSHEQLSFVAGFNPSIADKNFKAARPGEKVDLGVFGLGALPGLGQLVVIAAVDRYSSYAFAAIRANVNKANVAWLIEKRVLPFYKDKKALTFIIPHEMKQVSEFTVSANTPKIELISRARKYGPIGSVERFRLAVLNGFIKDDATNVVFDDLAALRAAFRDWVKHHNETGMVGFPNYGQPPITMAGSKRINAK